MAGLLALSTLVFAAVLLAAAAQDAHLSPASRQGAYRFGISRVKTTDCEPKRIVRLRFTTTYVISVASFSFSATVRRKCFPTKKAKSISKKEIACIKKRVSTSCKTTAPDEIKDICIMAQVRSCAPLADITMP